MIDDNDAYYIQQTINELQNMVQRLENRIEDLEQARYKQEHDTQQQFIKLNLKLNKITKPTMFG